jgi:hypothetical protein
VEGVGADGIDGFISGAAVGMSKGDEGENKEQTEHGSDNLYGTYRCRTRQEVGRRTTAYTGAEKVV